MAKVVADLRACDPEAEAVFKRRVRVKAEAPAWPTGMALLLLDSAVQKLNGLGVAASSTAGEDTLAISAGGLDIKEGPVGGTIFITTVPVTARWTSATSEVVVGGMDHSVLQRQFIRPSLDSKLVAKVADRVPAELLARWAAEHP